MDALDVATLKRIERLEKVVLTGNGNPSIVAVLTGAVTRLDAAVEDIKDIGTSVSDIKTLDSQRLEKKIDFERTMSRRMSIGLVLIFLSSFANFALSYLI